jgi:hypothetical protein
VRGLKEFAIAIARIILGIAILIGGMAVLDFIVYLAVNSSTFGEQIAAEYNSGYKKAYASSFDIGYQEAYDEAYNKGFGKGYEIGLGIGPKDEMSKRVDLSNPTFNELKDFLVGDETNLNSFVSGQYVCFHYAADLNNSAEANGFRAAYVRIRAQDWGHALVAFETVDRGFIFIEPQSDREVELLTKPRQRMTNGDRAGIPKNIGREGARLHKGASSPLWSKATGGGRIWWAGFRLSSPYPG